MSPAVEFICSSDAYIVSCLSKRFRLQHYHDIIYDAISHAKMEALRMYSSAVDITDEIYHTLSDAAYRYFSKELAISNAENDLREETYTKPRTDVDFTKLPYYKIFYNSRTSIERLIMETRADYTDPYLVQVITGYEPGSIAVRLYQLRNNYKNFIKYYTSFKSGYQRNNKNVNGILNRKILSLLLQGHTTSSIAKSIGISPKYCAVLVCRIRKIILQP